MAPGLSRGAAQWGGGISAYLAHRDLKNGPLVSRGAAQWGVGTSAYHAHDDQKNGPLASPEGLLSRGVDARARGGSP
eukprot:6197496-Alexandrium_andersonii.AAC.1